MPSSVTPISSARFGEAVDAIFLDISLRRHEQAVVAAADDCQHADHIALDESDRYGNDDLAARVARLVVSCCPWGLIRADVPDPPFDPHSEPDVATAEYLSIGHLPAQLVDASQHVGSGGS